MARISIDSGTDFAGRILEVEAFTRLPRVAVVAATRDAASGTRIVKIFLYLSKEEQRKRMLASIDEPEKNRKFSAADIAEGGFWDAYMQAYGLALAATRTTDSPGFIVPAAKPSMGVIPPTETGCCAYSVGAPVLITIRPSAAARSTRSVPGS